MGALTARQAEQVEKVRPTDLVTLSRVVLASQRKHPEATGDLTQLLASIQLGCKFVASAVRRAGLVSLTGLAGSDNVQGEAQKKLDVVANDIFVNSLRSSGVVGLMVTEEEEEPIVVNKEHSTRRYAVVFDPLDGSSNIDANVSIGTIFGVYKMTHGDVRDVLRAGREMVCAGYCVYGSAAVLVVALGGEVNGYTLDPQIGEFVLTDANMKVPQQGTVYSINDGNSARWTRACAEYVKLAKSKRGASARYIGSMVADVHRTIKYGGVFAYPGDLVAPNGKLRMLYECLPMSFIVEAAGGRSTTGTTSVLDLVPDKVHARCPIFLGSSECVDEVEKCYRKFPDKSSA